MVDWDVPPMELPISPTNLSDTDATGEHQFPDEMAAEEDEEDDGIFGMDLATGDDDEDDELGGFQLAVEGADDDDGVGSFLTSEVIPRRKSVTFWDSLNEDLTVASSLPAPRMGYMATGRSRCQSEMAPSVLGASPTLLSVLEQVATAQARHPGGRSRADSL